MMVAIPELDGATGPMVFGGRSSAAPARAGARHAVRTPSGPTTLAARVAKLVALRRTRAGRAQGRHRPVQLPAERRQHRHRRLPRRSSPRCTTRCRAMARRRLRGRGAGHASTRCASGSSTATPPASAPTPTSHARIPADDHVRRERWLRRDRGAVGPGARPAAERRRLDLRARRAVRQRVRRRPARLRLRGRPDAAAVREGLRADPRLLRLLPLPARGLRRPRRAAFRHPRRARVHARQADRPVGRLLAGPADRRPAELLPLRRQQPVRGHDRQAARGGDADQLSDAAGRPCRPLSRPARPEGLDRALARPAAGRRRRARRSLRR